MHHSITIAHALRIRRLRYHGYIIMDQTFSNQNTSIRRAFDDLTVVFNMLND